MANHKIGEMVQVQVTGVIGAILRDGDIWIEVKDNAGHISGFATHPDNIVFDELEERRVEKELRRDVR